MQEGLHHEEIEPSTETGLGARSDQQTLLLEVSAILAGLGNPERALPLALARVRERARLVRVSIYVVNLEDRVLRCVAESGPGGSDVWRALPLDVPGVAARAARLGETLYVKEQSDAPSKSSLAVPLSGVEGVFGVLLCESDRGEGIRAVTQALIGQITTQIALFLERSELSKKLRSSGEHFRSIIEQTHLGVALCDLEWRCLTVNSAFARLLGYTPEELRDKILLDFVNADDREETRESFRALTEGGKERLTVEKRLVDKSGNTVWGLAFVSMIRDAEGGPACTLAMVEDVSEKKRGEEDRARLEEQLLQAQKMESIGTLAGGLAHDFNNFLGVILGVASLARVRLQPNDPLLEAVEMIEHAAESAADLTRQLLGLARPEEYRPGPLSVPEVLKQVAILTTHTFDRRIRVETRAASELPAVEADAAQLEHAILNLCINARDAMPNGGTLTLEASRTSLGEADPRRPAPSPPGEYVVISVRDTGLGMEQSDMKHLFEPFSTSKSPGKGSGLVLAMVYRVVARHKGFVRAESEVLHGSHFSLYLPAVPLPAQPRAAPLAAKLERGSGTVLVVDDEPLVLAFVERALKKLGYEALTSDTGSQALEIFAFRAREIDGVILDMVMPEMSGLETLEKLREIDPQVKVLFSSGYSMGKVGREAVQMGAADFLAKPYTVEKLSSALRKIIHN